MYPILIRIHDFIRNDTIGITISVDVAIPFDPHLWYDELVHVVTIYVAIIFIMGKKIGHIKEVKYQTPVDPPAVIVNLSNNI